MAVTEILTRLCAPETCVADDPAQQIPLTQRWRRMSSDLRVVAGHLFLPDDLTRELPPIDNSWADFAAATAATPGTEPETPSPGDEDGGDDAVAINNRSEFHAAVAQDRRIPLACFVDGIQDTRDRPTLHFLHALLPTGRGPISPTAS